MKDKNSFAKQLPVTTGLLVIMLIVFLLETFDGGSQNISTLIKYGASFNPLIVMKNEWWRLVTAQFVHIGWLHLASNAVMIYYVGSILEPMIGSGRFLSVFLLSGVGGNLISFAFGNDITVSAGASTSLFGLFGIVIVYAIRLRGYMPFAVVGKQFFALAVVNLLLDLGMPSVDILGHIGGLIYGILIGIIIGGGIKKSIFNNKLRVLMLVCFIILTIFSFRQGLILSY